VSGNTGISSGRLSRAVKLNQGSKDEVFRADGWVGGWVVYEAYEVLKRGGEMSFTSPIFFE
jgi:hypothetical protein